MRYRPLGGTGAAVSSLTLCLGKDLLRRGPEVMIEMIVAALEAGINSYHLESADPVLAEVAGEGLGGVERELLTIGVSLGAEAAGRNFGAEAVIATLDEVLHMSGLGWLDAALLSEPGEHELSREALRALQAARTSGRIRRLGVEGGAEVMDAYVSTGAFEILATPYHLNADWKVRSRLRAARERDMGVFVYDYHPKGLGEAPSLLAAAKKGLFGRERRAPAGSGQVPFAFLNQTPNWSAEAICLGYILTDPSVSSVRIRPTDLKRLNELAETPERDLPPGLAAQIEMARVDAVR